MSTYYLDSYIGVKDGTKAPADRADGRKVGAKRSSIWGGKPSGQALASADQLFIADLAAGEAVRDIKINTDTSLGTTTLSVGTLTNPTKYANAVTLTAPLNVPVSIGPAAAQGVAAPLTAPEDIYITLGVGGIGAAVNLGVETIITSVK